MSRSDVSTEKPGDCPGNRSARWRDPPLRFEPSPFERMFPDMRDFAPTCRQRRRNVSGRVRDLSRCLAAVLRGIAVIVVDHGETSGIAILRLTVPLHKRCESGDRVAIRCRQKSKNSHDNRDIANRKLTQVTTAYGVAYTSPRRRQTLRVGESWQHPGFGAPAEDMLASRPRRFVQTVPVVSILPITANVPARRFRLSQLFRLFRCATCR